MNQESPQPETPGLLMRMMQYWNRLVAAYPAYEQARRFAGREIPLIRLRGVGGSSE